MNENTAWKIFEKTGRIQDYLNYRAIQKEPHNFVPAGSSTLSGFAVNTNSFNSNFTLK